MDIARAIEWSADTYTVRELMASCKSPMLAMVRQGHCSLRDEDSLSQGQIIRIARIHTQNRVIAQDSRGRLISIPLAFPLPFEVLPNNKKGSIRGTFRKLKKMQLTELVRNYQLPKKVKLPSALRGDPTINDLIGIDLVSGPIDLERLDDEVYLQGNAVNFGDLDTTVLNIPDHSDLEVALALGPLRGKQSQFRKLENKLADIVAKEVRFGDAVDSKIIKRLIHIGAEVVPAPRSRAGSTLRGGAPNGSTVNGHGDDDGGQYKKRDSRYSHPRLSVIEKRMKENNPPPVPSHATSNGNAFHFDNEAFDPNDLSESDELESENESEPTELPEVWADVKLNDDDDDDDLAPQKELFGVVSTFSFHNTDSWGFGNKQS